jgi:hypothetical protein
MTEVAQLQQAGTAKIADQINAEHRAYEASVKAALGHVEVALNHALDAGDLLLKAKAEQPLPDT